MVPMVYIHIRQSDLSQCQRHIQRQIQQNSVILLEFVRALKQLPAIAIAKIVAMTSHVTIKTCPCTVKPAKDQYK